MPLVELRRFRMMWGNTFPASMISPPRRAGKNHRIRRSKGRVRCFRRASRSFRCLVWYPIKRYRVAVMAGWKEKGSQKKGEVQSPRTNSRIKRGRGRGSRRRVFSKRNPQNRARRNQMAPI